MGYRIEILAGDKLRKTYTHNDFAILKFSLTQGLKKILLTKLHALPAPNDLNYVW